MWIQKMFPGEEEEGGGVRWITLFSVGGGGCFWKKLCELNKFEFSRGKGRTPHAAWTYIPFNRDNLFRSWNTSNETMKSMKSYIYVCVCVGGGINSTYSSGDNLTLEFIHINVSRLKRSVSDKTKILLI